MIRLLNTVLFHYESMKQYKKVHHLYLKQTTTAAAGFITHRSTHHRNQQEAKTSEVSDRRERKTPKNQRTCRQNEGLRSPRRKRGRGLVTVPTVWVKEVKDQMKSQILMMTNVNSSGLYVTLMLQSDYS